MNTNSNTRLGRVLPVKAPPLAAIQRALPRPANAGHADRPACAADRPVAASTFLTTAELGRVLRIHPDTVTRLVRLGMPFLKVGLRRRFVLGAVEQWFNSGKQP